MYFIRWVTLKSQVRGSDRRENVERNKWKFRYTRPKLAYCRQGLDWIVGLGYSFGVLYYRQTDRQAVIIFVTHNFRISQGRIKHYRQAVIKIIYRDTHFSSFTGGPTCSSHNSTWFVKSDIKNKQRHVTLPSPTWAFRWLEISWVRQSTIDYSVLLSWCSWPPASPWPWSASPPSPPSPTWCTTCPSRATPGWPPLQHPPPPFQPLPPS